MKSEFNKIKEIKSKDSSVKEFMELLQSENEAVHQAVISNAAFSENMQISLATDITTPVEVMYVLSKSHYVVVRNCLATNKNCPIEIIEYFFQKKDALMGVASNIKTPTDILEAIFNMDNGVYKEFLSSNVSTPHKLLEVLCIDEEEYIRMSVAANTSAPEYVLTVLAKDMSKEVRSKVAANKNSSLDVLKQLIEDNSYITKIAKSNLRDRKSDQEKMTDLQNSLKNTPSSIDEFSLL